MNHAALKRRGYSVAEMRRLAQSRLPRAVFDFADGGAGTESTLRRSEAGFGELAFLPRPLGGTGPRDLSVSLFGMTLKLPVILAPTGLSSLYWPDGEICAARAAAAAGSAYVLSHASSCTIEELAGTGAAPRWMQTFIYSDRGLTREFASRAAAAGYGALVVTVDNAVGGHRERDIRNGFTIPRRIGPAMIAGMMARPAWLWRQRHVLRGLTLANYRRPGETGRLTQMSGRVSTMLDCGPGWRDIEDIRRSWTGPLLVKGILHPADAVTAADLGVDGVIVSTHGGRQLDGAQAPIDALPAVVDAAGDRLAVLLDGGVRRGADVVKAIALGARACLVGRPQIWGLTVAGEAGVAHVLDLLRTEIDRTLALLGVTSLSGLTRACLVRCAPKAMP